MSFYNAIEEAERLYNEKKMRSTTPSELQHQCVVERITQLYPDLSNETISNVYQDIMNIENLLSGLDNTECKQLMQNVLKIVAANKLSEVPFKVRAINGYMVAVAKGGFLDEYINKFVGDN